MATNTSTRGADSEIPITSSNYYNILTRQIAAVLGASAHPPRINSATGNWLLWDNDTERYTDSGYRATGVDVPAGGTTNQVLKKKSAANYDFEWASEGAGDRAVLDLQPLANFGEEQYALEAVTWEQGGFNSSGDTESTVWIRSPLLPGGILIRNSSSARRFVVGRIKDSDGSVTYPWMDSDSTAEWYWIPNMTGYHIKIRERYLTNNTDITPSENSLEIYRPNYLLDLRDTLPDSGLVWIDSKLARPASAAFEQGGFSTSGDNNATTAIRTGWLTGGVYLYNPGGKMIFAVLRNNGASSDNLSWMTFTTAATPENFYSDELVFLPELKIGQYRILVQRRNDADTGDMQIAPEQSSLKLCAPLPEGVSWMLGSLGSGGYSYSVTNAVTEELELGDFAALRVRLVDARYRFGVYTVSGSTYKLQNLDFQRQGEYNGFDKTKKYVVRVGAVSGQSFVYADAVRAVEIERTDNAGYSRCYSEITGALAWEHKTISASGIAASDYALLAELPNTGNVEIRMNRPYIKFSVWFEKNGVFTQLQDWTHYFCRYTADSTGDPHYYVCVMLQSEESTAGSVTPGRRGVQVYTYADFGQTPTVPSPVYGQTVAVFGDSIVQGRCRKNGADSTNTTMAKPWPQLIAEAGGVEPGNYGIGGAQVYGSDWTSLYTNRSQVTGYAVVLVCAGSNDFGADVTEANFKAAYADVLTALKANNSRVIAVTPPCRAEDATNGLNLSLEDYSHFVSAVAAAQDVEVIDLYWMTRTNALFRANLPDDIHPNEIGQRIIADLILHNFPGSEGSL